MLNNSRFLLRLGVTFLALACLGLFTAQPALTAEPLPQWNETEIISNDRALIKLARLANRIAAGDQIALDDLRLKSNCNQIRAAISEHQVACTAILDGNNRYIYVVQIFSHALKVSQPTCVLGKKLPKTLSDLAARISADTISHLSAVHESQHGEYIGEDNVLTYYSESRKVQALQYHDALRGKSPFLDEGVQSCDTQQRADAFVLMNYVGDVALIKRTIRAGIIDPEPAVRNSALRLVSTFHGIFNTIERSQLIEIACANVKGENFFDLNKSLAVLYEFVLASNPGIQKFPPDCALRIKYLADISHTEQIGGYARRILEIFQGNPN